MNTNHSTCKTNDATGNPAADNASPNTPSQLNNEKNMSPLEHPRYKENPVYLIFECYIEDTIGHLPEKKSRAIQDMNLQKVFKTKSTAWKSVIRETLLLSDTIDIAIQDLWYQNRDDFMDNRGQFDTYLFSQVFTNEFMEDGSTIDVWPPGALYAAKERISRAQAMNKTEP